MKSLKMFSRISIIVALFSAFVLISGCSKSTGYSYPTTTNNNQTPTQGSNDIFLQNMAFSPSSKTVAVGTTVTWTNLDNVGHNVTSTTGVFSSGLLNMNGTFSFTFSTAGIYNYKCTIHPSMTGTITVQ
jgi:plastocyanin